MDTVMVETRRCVVCGRSALLEVPLEGLRLWQNGEVITRALPGLDADQRELLISGTHAPCWEQMWAGYHEDEECAGCGEILVQDDVTWATVDGELSVEDGVPWCDECLPIGPGEWRSCSSCERVEPAGASPDQDDAGRCAECAERDV